MAGLLGDVLPFLYSQGDRAKRWAGGLLSDPMGTITREVNYGNDRAGAMLGLLSQATNEGMNNGPATQKLTQVLADAYNPVAATVWHGTPHKFNKFDSSKIGTGEGAQAYGHGLYFAENPATATEYQKMLSQRLTVDGKPVLVANKSFPTGNPLIDENLVAAGGNLKAAEKEALQAVRDLRATSPNHPNIKEAQQELAGLRQLRGRVENTTAGNLYKVDLPDSAIAKMLDWDKPLSQQAGLIDVVRQERPGYMQLPPGQTKASDAYMALADKVGPDKAAEAFRKAGIPGIKYLDGGSRGAGTGTRNYVVFPGNESLLTILERNGMPLP